MLFIHAYMPIYIHMVSLHLGYCVFVLKLHAVLVHSYAISSVSTEHWGGASRVVMAGIDLSVGNTTDANEPQQTLVPTRCMSHQACIASTRTLHSWMKSCAA